MNIYATNGDKVKFNNFHGTEFDRSYITRKGIKNGDILTVDYTAVGDWSTDVYFKEVQGSFNSVCFDDVAMG